MLKKFKLGFAAFIAVLAISATLASYAGAFNGTKMDPPEPGCFREVNNNEPTACGTIPALCATDVLTEVDIDVECDDNPEFACCFIVTDTPCPTNPNGLVVTQIQCGEYTEVQ